MARYALRLWGTFTAPVKTVKSQTLILWKLYSFLSANNFNQGLQDDLAKRLS